MVNKYILKPVLLYFLNGCDYSVSVSVSVSEISIQ